MLLDKGRFSEPTFDIKHSPLSVFLYTNLGSAKIKQLFIFAKALFEKRLKVHEFLAKIDRPVVAVIAQASAAMVTTRREKLLEYTKTSLLACDQEWILLANSLSWELIWPLMLMRQTENGAWSCDERLAAKPASGLC
jgi:hypothetical protein